MEEICGIGNQDHQDTLHRVLRRSQRHFHLRFNTLARSTKLLLLFRNSAAACPELDPRLLLDHQQTRQLMLASRDHTDDLHCRQATFNSLIKPNPFERVGQCHRQVA